METDETATRLDGRKQAVDRAPQPHRPLLEKPEAAALAEMPIACYVSLAFARIEAADA